MNITEGDLIKTYTVGDVANKSPAVIGINTSMTKILDIFASTNALYYPVVDSSKKLLGAITIDGVRNIFTTQGINDWLIALDIMEPVISNTRLDVPLALAIKQAGRLDIVNLPVVTEDGKFTGLLNTDATRRKIAATLLEKQREADMMYRRT